MVFGFFQNNLFTPPPIPRGLSAAIYTQVSDIEEEVNGIYTYDRELLKIEEDTLQKWNLRLRESG